MHLSFSKIRRSKVTDYAALKNIEKIQEINKEVLNTFENTIMENGAFAPDDECSMFHNIFKYMFFQSRQKALLWSKGLNHAFTNYVISTKFLYHRTFWLL